MNAFTGRYQPTPVKEWEKPDCVIAHAFGLVEYARIGDPGEEKLGQANSAIAKYVFTSFRTLPKIMQIEVMVAYERFEDHSLQPIFTIEENRSRGAHLDTREVNSQAVDIMRWYGWRRAIVVAHAHHLVRVDATLRKMGVETIIPSGLPKIWDRHAEQAEVRSALRFGLVTIAAVGIYKFHGWI